MIGSTAAARRAGRYAASSVAIVSTRQAPASAAGSVGDTPKRNARSEYPTASDSGTPTTSAALGAHLRDVRTGRVALADVLSEAAAAEAG